MVFKVPEQRGGWLDPVRRCHTRGAVRFCDGPRRVPKPYGPADRLADTLGLGTHRAGAELLRSPPRELWRDAVSRLGFELPEQLLWPVAGGNFGRGFGPRTTRSGKRKLHEGIDVGAEPGELIYAVADGLVGYADNSVRGYGNLLLIVHAEGAVSAYAHCKELLVFPGQTVERGQIVGKVGNTGLSRGPHLHFEWHERGRAVDPAHMFEVPSR
jgi:murein DD-endopeptidase MepM/ murein hydrolase activator NlpD